MNGRAAVLVDPEGRQDRRLLPRLPSSGYGLGFGPSSGISPGGVLQCSARASALSSLPAVTMFTGDVVAATPMLIVSP